MKQLMSILTNKYLLVSLAAAVWMVFFDNYNVLSRNKMADKLAELRADKRFYEQKIDNLQGQRKLLEGDIAEAERIARERYLMKRANEDIYVLTHPDSMSISSGKSL